MKSLDEVKAFYKDATIDTNPASDRTVLTDANQAGALTNQKRTAHEELGIWRLIMKNNITKLATAGLVILLVTLGLSLLDLSTPPALGMADAIELMAQVKTIHARGWRLQQGSSTDEPLKLPFEYWYDFENSGTHVDSIDYQGNGNFAKRSLICDNEYVMIEEAHKTTGDTWQNKTVTFERHDPNLPQDGRELTKCYEFRQIEGFVKVGKEVINDKYYVIWQGEYTSGGGDNIRRERLRAWLCPDTGQLRRYAFLEKRENQWITTLEYTSIEGNASLPEDIFLTEPRPDYDIKTPKEEAVLPGRPAYDIYDDTVLSPLKYGIRRFFALKGGCLLACWQGIDNTESRDQSKYFANLQPGGELPKLPVEIFALSPEPNIRDVNFIGFHLTHTEKETERGRRWYEWSLYIPDQKPPEPNAVFKYRIHYRVNVNRTDNINIGTKLLDVRNPRNIETGLDFETKVLKAMAERSDDGLIPEHVTYESVMKLAEQLRASITE